MTGSREKFLAALRENADSWHAAEIDYATFTKTQQQIWHEIRNEGRATEREVLQALRDQLPTLASSSTERARRLAGSGLGLGLIVAAPTEPREHMDDDSTLRGQPASRASDK